MLHLLTQRATRHCDGLTRREVLRVGAIGLGGLTLPALLRLEQTAKAATKDSARPARKPQSVVLLFLSDGPSQLDRWDLKPEAPAEIRGTFRPISTAVPGIQISEHLPRSARLADRFAMVRSMHHATANHPAASYWMMVGSPIARAAPQAVTLSREDRPHPGSVLAKLLPGSAALPSFVMVPEAISPVGPERPGQYAGFLGAAYDPYRINSDANLPGYSAGALSPRPELSSTRLSSRRSLLRQLARQGSSLDQAALSRPL